MKLSEKHLEVITRTVLEHLKQESIKQNKRKHDRRLRNMKLLLRNYRSFVLHCQDIKLELNELDAELELDEFDTDDFAIESIRRSKTRTLALVKFINKMFKVYEIICKESGDPEDIRRYHVIDDLYISTNQKSVKEIATCQNIDPRTVYRDVDKACETLSGLMFGVDSIRFF